jgi:hypothetical protein
MHRIPGHVALSLAVFGLRPTLTNMADKKTAANDAHDAKISGARNI